MADKLADEVKGEFHHKLIHNITIAIGEAKAGTPPNDGKIPITVLGEDVT
jgi:hypothetical protein